MIKKLRKKFILIALAVVAAVLIVIVAGIDVANYLDMRADADDTIAFLEMRNDAHTPFGPKQGDLPLPGAEEEQGGPPLPGAEEEQGEKPDNLPRETAFSARYFTVETDAAGNVIRIDRDKVAYVSEEEAEIIVTEAKGEKGFVENYRYLRRETAEGGYRYFFLDCEKELDACRTFIVSSAIITVIGLAVIALLIILLSKKALAPVEESYKKQKQFITDAGHELKTPLTVISANAELLELDVGEDNEWLQSIKGQVQKLSSLTKELVYLSRMDEGEGRVEKAPFSLESALEDCAATFREAAMVAGKEIKLDLEEVTMNGNEEMLRRAFTLIIDNAVKYAESPEISVTLRKDGKKAIIEEINASSLEKGEHPELFERFYRPDASRSSATGGHGIGLSVVKAIAEAHGGEATCTAGGSRVTFRLSLPL